MITFITGDRSMAIFYPGQVAVEMIRALGQGNGIATGENDGVEAIVRALANEAGVEIGIVTNPETPLENGKVDWDARHATLPDHMTVVGVHADPHDSRVLQSVLRVVPDDRVRLVTAVDLLA